MSKEKKDAILKTLLIPIVIAACVATLEVVTLNSFRTLISENCVTTEVRYEGILVSQTACNPYGQMLIAKTRSAGWETFVTPDGEHAVAANANTWVSVKLDEFQPESLEVVKQTASPEVLKAISLLPLKS